MYGSGSRMSALKRSSSNEVDSPASTFLAHVDDVQSAWHILEELLESLERVD